MRLSIRMHSFLYPSSPSHRTAPRPAALQCQPSVKGSRRRIASIDGSGRLFCDWQLSRVGAASYMPL